VVVDATLGLGGHAEALLTRCPNARLVGLDRDPEALRLAGRRLARFGDRLDPVQAVYDELPAVLASLAIHRVQGILFDLGVSSLQLDESERGFAYSYDAPLDMRMDPRSGPSAAEFLNVVEAAELSRVLSEYGDVPRSQARRVAQEVVHGSRHATA
jgi:16S rRNA (cytosine1402-N4)-methyltransferase